jgi:acetylglutamate synthase
MVVPIALSQAWIGVVGALGGVAITGIIALITARLNHAWTAESTREARAHDMQSQRGEVRRVAYARLLAASENIKDAAESVTLSPSATDEEKTASAWYQAHPEALQEMQTADGEARIVAGDEVFDAIDAHVTALDKYLNALFSDPEASDNRDVRATLDVLVQAMRREQAVDLTLRPGQ